MTNAVETVSKPIELPFSGKTVPNRFLKSAMTERLCTWSQDNPDERGKPTKEYIEAYKQWGEGQLGVVTLGNIPCHREHPEAAGNAIIDPDSPWDPVEAFKPVVDASKAHGSLCLGQVTHAGRQCSSEVQPQPVSASAGEAYDAIGMHFNAARALKTDEIKDIVRRFAFAAEVLHKAGADGIQLHAAHGYLLSQFLSAAINHRDDQYGGSFENRSRLIFEILAAIDEKVPKSFIRAIKINSHDFQGDGWTAEDCSQIVQKLEAAGVDLIELSGGNYQNLAFEHKRESTKKREGFFIEFAEQIRPHVKKAVLCVTGGFRTVEKCAEAISSGTCDMVGMARPLTADPQLPAHILHGKTNGAALNHVPSQLQTPAAVQQIHAIAESREIPDYCDEKVAKEWTEKIKSGDFPRPIGNYPPA